MIKMHDPIKIMKGLIKLLKVIKLITKQLQCRPLLAHFSWTFYGTNNQMTSS